MFSCKVCAEKDNRNQDLKKEIEFLKRLVLPTPNYPKLNIEENFALSGASSEAIEPELSVEEQLERAKVEAERDAILSGNY